MPKRIFRALAIWIALCSSAAAAVPPLTPEQVLSGGHFYGHMRLDGELYSSYYRESQNGGDPWAQRNVHIANSPWFSLDKVTTPLLVLHGEQDHTLPVWQAEAVVVGLARLGRTVSFARFTGEGHVPARWKWANQLEYDRRMIAWFEKYLR